MKKIILIFVMVFSIMSICACASNNTDSVVVGDAPSMFVKVEDGPYWNVYYHKDTKVMYAVSYSSYNCGTFTLLVNPDGTPMLWEE